MFGAIVLAIILAAVPSLKAPKPLWWKIITIAAISISLVWTILPNVAGSPYSLKYLQMGQDNFIDIKINNPSEAFIFNEQSGWLEYPFESKYFSGKIIWQIKELPSDVKKAERIIVKVIHDPTNQYFEVEKVTSVDPFMVYPYVPNLDERIKILNLHVPQSWIAVIAYIMSMIFAIKYLRTRDMKFDAYTASTAAIGTVFSILATVTGMVWAKFNWGSFWNWDPRETSIFVLILIYAAFFALRSSIEDPEKRAKLSSVYSILAFITVPFLVFVLPRIQQGLHPGSASDVNSGPVVSKEPGALDSNMLYSFGLSLFGFAMLFFWIFNIHLRAKLLEKKLLNESNA